MLILELGLTFNFKHGVQCKKKSNLIPSSIYDITFLTLLIANIKKLCNNKAKK